jgi:hypothetical protein
LPKNKLTRDELFKLFNGKYIIKDLDKDISDEDVYNYYISWFNDQNEKYMKKYLKYMKKYLKYKKKYLLLRQSII